MQFDVKNAFQSPHEAQVAFEAVLASDRGYVTKPNALEEWVSKVGGLLDDERRPPEPEPVAVIPEPEPSPPPPSLDRLSRPRRRRRRGRKIGRPSK